MLSGLHWPRWHLARGAVRTLKQSCFTYTWERFLYGESFSFNSNKNRLKTAESYLSFGANNPTRTDNRLITNQLRYRLRHISVLRGLALSPLCTPFRDRLRTVLICSRKTPSNTCCDIRRLSRTFCPTGGVEPLRMPFMLSGLCAIATLQNKQLLVDSSF